MNFRNLVATAVLFSVYCVTLNESAAQAKDVYVKGYTRKDGTYVKGHRRSSPDGDFSNNWSTRGNVNPHTGEWGTRTRPSDGYYGNGSSFTTTPSIGNSSSEYVGNDASGFKRNPYMQRNKVRANQHRIFLSDGTAQDVVSYSQNEFDYLVETLDGSFVIPKSQVARVELIPDSTTQSLLGSDGRQQSDQSVGRNKVHLDYLTELDELLHATRLWAEKYEQFPVARQAAWDSLEMFAEVVQGTDVKWVEFYTQKLQAIEQKRRD